MAEVQVPLGEPRGGRRSADTDMDVFRSALRRSVRLNLTRWGRKSTGRAWRLGLEFPRQLQDNTTPAPT
jgi:hypothetical protein